MSFLESYFRVIDLLHKGCLLEAINLEKELIKSLDNWALRDELSQIESTYLLMLKYFSNGVEDQRRADVYDSLVWRCMALAEKIKRQTGINESSNPYYAKLRNISRLARTLLYYTKRLEAIKSQELLRSIMNDDEDEQFSEGEVPISRDKLMNELFDFVWVADIFSEDELAALKGLFSADYLDYAEKQWLISALTLSLLFYYDEAKMQALVDLVECDDELLHMRALVGCSIVAMYNKKRFALRAPKFSGHSKGVVSQTLVMLQLQWLMEYKTKFLSKKINTDFISMVMHMKGKIDSAELTSLLEDDDAELPLGIDPEIAKEFRSKIYEAEKMANSGLDVAYNQLRSLRAFPFFSEIRNWVKPFDMPSTGDDAIRRRLSFLFANSLLCHGDKYAILEVFKTMPDSLSDIFGAQLQGLEPHADDTFGYTNQELSRQVEIFTSWTSEIGLSAKKEHFLAFAPLYIQDLYRLFTIKITEKEEGNPFYGNEAMLFVDNKMMSDNISKHDLLILISRTYTERMYAHTLRLIDLLDEASRHSQKIVLMSGVSAAMTHQYTIAIDAFSLYEKMGETLSAGCMSLYAGCLEAVGNTVSAIEIYKRQSQTNESNVSLFNYANALCKAKLFEQACEILYKEDYLRPSQSRVQRLLGTCLLNTKKPVEAAAVYKKLVCANDVQAQDYFNYAHALLANGEITDAIDNYRLSKPLKEIDEAAYLNFGFTPDDVTLLSSLGVSELTISLVNDVIKFV